MNHFATPLPFRPLFWATLLAPFLFFPGTSLAEENGDGPKFSVQTQSRESRLDPEATEASIKASIDNQEQILQLEDPGSPNFAKQAMALADFYWDLAEFYGHQVHSEAIEKPLYDATQAKNEAEIERWTREQQRLSDLKRVYQEETIKKYRDIINRFPNIPKLDEVRYFLAYNLSDMGRGEEGVKEYANIFSHHPNSKYIPDALVNIGDYYFDQNSFLDAVTIYEKTKEYKDSQVYGYALYKEAWCYYNMGDYFDSMDRFLEVIAYANEQLAKSGSQGLALKREAQNEILLPYSKVGEPKKAFSFLSDKAHAGDRLLELTGKLATIYTSQNEIESANELLRLLMIEAQKPTADGSDKSYLMVRFQRQIVENTRALAKKAPTVKEIAKLIDIYHEKMPSAPKDFQFDETDDIKRIILATAANYQAEFDKTQEQVTLEYTQKLYADYLRVFKQDENAYEISWNNALLLMSTEKYEAAAAAFEALIEEDPKGKYADSAAERAVLAYVKVLEFKKNELKNEAESDLEAIELPPADQRFVTAVDRWMKLIETNGLNPETAETVPLARFGAAKIMYDYNHFDDSGQRFAVFIKENPKHELTDTARRMLLSAFNLSSNVDELRNYANQFEALPNLPSDLREDVEKIKNAFDYQECQKLQTAKSHLEAARCYEQYAKDFPHGDKTVQAMYNASIARFDAKQVEQSLKMLRTLYSAFPKDKLANKALYAIGDIYRETTVYDQASTFYEAFAANHPDHELAEQALRYASIFRKTLGDYAKAVANLNTYLKRYPNHQNAAQVHLDIIKIYDKQEFYGRVVTTANYHMRKYKNEAPSVRLQVLNLQGLALSKQRKNTPARKVFQQTVDTFLRLDDQEKKDLTVAGVSAVAESHFELGEISLREARAITVTGRSQKQITSVIAQKRDMLAKVKDTYEKVIAYGHPGWVIAASTQLGVAYQDFAEAIEQAPVPSQIARFPDAVNAYHQAMTDTANEIAELALLNYKRAIKRAQDDRWFNLYSERAERAVAELDLNDTSVKEFRLRPDRMTPNGGLPLFAGIQEAEDEKESL